MYGGLQKESAYSIVFIERKEGLEPEVLL